MERTNHKKICHELAVSMNSPREVDGILTDEQIKAIRTRVLEWGQANFQDFPWRHTNDPYVALVTEVLLQRTRASSVARHYDRFFDSFPDARSLASASIEEIRSEIHGLGLHWRAPLLKALGGKIIDIGEIPSDYNNLIGLPAVGPYAASAFISLFTDKRAVLLDSNLVRWICRLLCVRYHGETRRQKWVEDLAERITPADEVRDFNYALLDFTMKVCLPRSPRCGICPVGPDFCCHGQKVLSSRDASPTLPLAD
jgi:A/G-specific adenine glycosylase